jgi:hypothetical protein
VDDRVSRIGKIAKASFRGNILFSGLNRMERGGTDPLKSARPEKMIRDDG